MSKKIIIPIIIVVVLALVAFLIYKKFQAPSAKDQASVVNAIAQSSVAGGVEKANPFNVDVNPYKGYKNPFQ